MEPLWPVLLFASVHVFIVLNVASTNSWSPKKGKKGAKKTVRIEK